MGLGKTIQALVTCAVTVKTTKRAGCVVVPLAVLSNWASEAATFVPSLPIRTFYGSREEREHALANWVPLGPGLVLTTYEIWAKEGAAMVEKEGPLSVLVFDEGHKLKNPGAVASRVLLHDPLASSRPPVILLTGTPVQNSRDELYTLCWLADPDAFPLTFPDLDQLDAWEASSPEAVRDAIRPILLRRTRDGVLSELPPLSSYVIPAPMTPMQRAYYKAVLARDGSSLAAVAGSGAAPPRMLMSVLNSLRKACNHPYLFEGAEPEPFEEGEHLVANSGKLRVLDALLTRLAQDGHRALVFSQSTRMLDILQDYLTLRGYGYERLDGSTRAEERFAAVSSFSSTDQAFVFLLSTRAGGVGLNLTMADTVIFVDTDWNPQMDLQAQARVHRMGQTKPVSVFRIVVPGTVDELMVRRALSKLDLADELVGLGGGTAPPKSSGVPLGVGDLAYGMASMGQDESEGQDDDDASAVVDRVLELGTGAGPGMYEFEGIDYAKEGKGASEEDKAALEALAPGCTQVKDADASAASQTAVTSRRKRKRKISAGALRAVLGSDSDSDFGVEDSLSGEEGDVSGDAEYVAPSSSSSSKRAKSTGALPTPFSPDADPSFRLGDLATFATPSGSTPGVADLLGSATTDEVDFEFTVGSVANPEGIEDAVIVVAADKSGWWSKRGIFRAISGRTRIPAAAYTHAGSFQGSDALTEGDVLLIPITVTAFQASATAAASGTVYASSKICLPQGATMSSIGEGRRRVWVAVVIALERASRQSRPVLSTSALQRGMSKLCTAAAGLGATLHVPRFGDSDPSVSWYVVERVLRRSASSAGVPCRVYYFSRRTQP